MKKRLEPALIAVAMMLAGAVCSPLSGTAAASTDSAAGDARVAMLSPFPANIAAGSNTSTPIGYAQFCQANPGDCEEGNGRGGRVALNSANYAQLKQINDDINERIKPMTDLEQFGEAERWSYPDDGYGDCEDYVLLKRRTLIEHDWPAETLLITVVRDRNNDGHAVLTVVTDRGDLVLDNQEAEITLWHETGYRFVKRQAQGDPNRWVSLGDVLAPVTVGRN